MNEYITKEDTQLARPEWRCRNDQYDCGWNDCINEYLDIIDTIPAADVRLIVRGKWIDTGSGQECSICSEFQPGYDNYRNFCPNCGADMRGNNE